MTAARRREVVELQQFKPSRHRERQNSKYIKSAAQSGAGALGEHRDGGAADPLQKEISQLFTLAVSQLAPSQFQPDPPYSQPAESWAKVLPAGSPGRKDRDNEA